MNRRGYTLVEMMIATAIMAVISAAFAALIRSSIVAETKVINQSQSQEGARRGLMMLEQELLHANEIQVASSTYVQYIVDIDQSPNYDPNGDMDGDGIPNYLDADRDGDADLLMGATAQWQVGFNLKDDDEDKDGKIDVRKRIYLSSKTIYEETSVNEAAWSYKKTLAVHVSSVTFTYFGNKANQLGASIDANGDGIISVSEIDAAGNANGALDTESELEYLTTVRINMTVDWNGDGKTDYSVETDVYPPLLPLKSQTF